MNDTQLGSQCILCAKPLGSDSKDTGWLTCLEHRTCSVCNQPLTVVDVKLAYSFVLDSDGATESLELKHARCRVPGPGLDISSDPTLSVKQSYFDWLNTCRLCIQPDMALSKSTNETNAQVYHARFIEKMTFDEVYTHIGMMEACVMQARLAVSKDKEVLKKRADAREEHKFAQAKRQADTSTRPSGKSSEDEKEVSLALFMTNFSITSRKVALRLQKDRDKSAASLNAIVKNSVAAMDAANTMLKDSIAKGKTKVTEE